MWGYLSELKFQIHHHGIFKPKYFQSPPQSFIITIMICGGVMIADMEQRAKNDVQPCGDVSATQLASFKGGTIVKQLIKMEEII